MPEGKKRVGIRNLQLQGSKIISAGTEVPNRRYSQAPEKVNIISSPCEPPSFDFGKIGVNKNSMAARQFKATNPKPDARASNNLNEQALKVKL